MSGLQRVHSVAGAEEHDQHLCGLQRAEDNQLAEHPGHRLEDALAQTAHAYWFGHHFRLQQAQSTDHQGLREDYADHLLACVRQPLGCQEHRQGPAHQVQAGLSQVLFIKSQNEFNSLIQRSVNENLQQQI